MSYLFVLLGVALLYAGGELLVRNASHLARTFGLSSLVIGLTVVAFGTSAPELATTLLSTLEGSPEVAVGNVVGSNIANIGLILGLTALIYPLQSARRFIRREVPFMVVVGALLFPVFWDGVVARYEGLLLLALLGGYLWYQFQRSENVSEVVPEVPEDEAPKRTVPIWRAWFGVAAGVAVLVAGAQALVTGAVTIAQSFGVPERIVGLTLVAVGTSLPELASSLVAALRREPDLILGNVVGSNIFNILAILGLTALIYPIRLGYAAIQTDLLVMLGISVFVLPLMLPRYRLGRMGGVVLLALYAAYIAVLFL